VEVNDDNDDNDREDEEDEEEDEDDEEDEEEDGGEDDDDDEDNDVSAQGPTMFDLYTGKYVRNNNFVSPVKQYNFLLW
jgi:hypothetical protein